MPLTIYTFLFVLLVIAEVFYIRAARHWDIIDRPNERSLHTNRTTVRGGGVIFWLAACSVFIHSGFALPWFFLGLTLVATISFLDDIRQVPKQYRLVIQLIGWSLTLVQFGILPSQWGLWVLLLLIGVGVLNAYNFMDGINGITAFYSLVTVGSQWYWFGKLPTQESENALVTETALLFPVVFMSLLIFAYFNVRKQAVCFAGDVGSVSMGFIISYGLLCLVWVTHSLLPLLLLTVYGIDTSLTIGQRLWQKQNIFQPHRQHLFQVLVREGKWTHLEVAALYAIVQLAINYLVISALDWSSISQWLFAGTILSVMISTYCIAKWRLTCVRRGIRA